jgi:drug/metabolite transporter (DMT)-like permease
LIWERKRNKSRAQFKIQKHLFPALLTGLVLFAGASFQQIGLLGTTAGKAGLITGLYVVLVPLMALLWGKRTHPAHWLGAVLAAVGLYFLSVQQGFTVAPYDLIVLAGAFIWAGHVHLIDRYVRKVGAVRLSILQFAICGLLSGVSALIFESIELHGMMEGLGPILYGGILSVGVAYTLQVMAQRHADPAHAAIILSLEGAFAALGGWLVLGEYLSIKEIIGLLLMMAGSILSISTVILD